MFKGNVQKLNFKGVKFFVHKKRLCKKKKNISKIIKNSDFVLIKDFDKSMTSKIKHHNKKHFCRYSFK